MSCNFLSLCTNTQKETIGDVEQMNIVALKLGIVILLSAICFSFSFAALNENDTQNDTNGRKCRKWDLHIQYRQFSGDQESQGSCVGLQWPLCVHHLLKSFVNASSSLHLTATLTINAKQMLTLLFLWAPININHDKIQLQMIVSYSRSYGYSPR